MKDSYGETEVSSILYRDAMNERMYIEMIPDLFESGVRHEQGNYVALDMLHIDPGIRERIAKWNSKYKNYLSIGWLDWVLRWHDIYLTDKEGYEIASLLQKTYDMKVKYYSSALGRFLLSEPEPSNYKPRWLRF